MYDRCVSGAEPKGWKIFVFCIGRSPVQVVGHAKERHAH